MKQLLFSLLLALSLPSIVSARELTASEKTNLTDRVVSFTTAFQQSDFEEIGKAVPPKIIEAIAVKAGVSVDRLREAQRSAMQTTLAAAKIVEFSLDENNVEYKQTPDGTPYALIPTRTVIHVEQGKIETLSHTLGLLDGPAWYLLRVGEMYQVSILRQVYPSFASIEFPESSLKAVE